MRIISGIPMTEVESSNISKLGYDEQEKTMQVQFKNGAVWQYHPITADFYKELKGADSIGRHFNTHVKGNQNLEAKEIHPKNRK